MYYRSWQIAINPAQTIPAKVYFNARKKGIKLTQWTVIIQYQYLGGSPAQLPPPIVSGVSVNITGLVTGIGGILNVVSSSQSWVPIVGATYRVFGDEIQIAFGNDAAIPVNMQVSAVEDSNPIVDGESKFADSGIDVTIPQFATSFSVAISSTGFRQKDSLGTPLTASYLVTPGQFCPLHPMAYFIQDGAPQFQIYSFKKGYT